MALGPGGMPLAGDVWAARPKPLSALWGGAKAGAPIGAAAGLWSGGPAGAVVGAAIGTAVGVVTASAGRLRETMDRLERSTRSIIEQYKAYSPVIARLRQQWMLLDRRLNRIWAETLAPTLKKLTDIGTEFRERWTRMKVDLFQAIEPALKGILNMLQNLSRATLWTLEKFLKVINTVIEALSKLPGLLGLLPEERERGLTQALGPYTMEWPSIEGPLSGAMRRAGLTGPPFTGEEARRPEPKEERGDWKEGVRRGLTAPPFPFQFPPETKRGEPDVKIDVKVGDSKELSAAFERIWHEATYELRKIEVEEMYKAYLLQTEGTYV